MPSPLPVWVRTSKWTPASAGGGSQGFSVECPSTNELGHGKPVYIPQEILASLFADEVAVVVPPTQLGNCEDKTIAVSKLFGSKSMDIPALKAASPKEYSSEALKGALRRASGLLPFHAWVGSSDLKDEHVMVRPQSQGVYEIASIDFASAFGFDDSGGAVAVPPGPPALIVDEHRDPNIIRQTIERIEAVSETRIKELIETLPDDVLARTDKNRIAAGLYSRRTAVRPAFQAAGWLPKGR